MTIKSKIIIDTEQCKGCGLCMSACPKGCITVSKQSNKNGYFPSQATGDGCTGCTLCAIICPETIIEVYRDNKSINIVAIEPDKKNSKSIIRKKT